jgi:hypothetical protein
MDGEGVGAELGTTLELLLLALLWREESVVGEGEMRRVGN